MFRATIIRLPILVCSMFMAATAYAQPPAAPVALEDGYADVNGVRLHYKSAGQGKLILFLHGFPEFWYEWKSQLADFGQDYKAVAPDMRGYNLSSKPSEVDQYALKILVEDVRALAAHFGAKKFVLVGHDWGGIVAWTFAAYYPELLEKLVIINTPHPVIFERELRENPAQQFVSQYMLLLNTPGKAEQNASKDNFAILVDVTLAEGLKQAYRTEEDRKAYIDEWSQPGALTGGMNYYRAARIRPTTEEGGSWSAKDTVPDLPSFTVTVPTLVIWGMSDPYLLTGNLSGLQKLVPNLTVKLLPDVGHWVANAKPKEVDALIRDFLRP
jgi:epoxide hydrolase 4